MSPFFGNLWWLWGVLMRGVGQIYYGGGLMCGLRRQVTADGRIFTVKLLPCPAKRKRFTAASHGRWTNIHGETLALSCETKNISAIYVPACRCAYTWSHKSQYFSFLGRAANVSRWNIRPCCLGAGVGRVGAIKSRRGIPKWEQEWRLLR